MPRPTFFALPSDKRERFIRAAVQEFSTQPYVGASLDRIAAGAGVSKGSVYQYFDDKLDLYRWLILEHVPAQKQKSGPPPDLRDLGGWFADAFMQGLEQFRSSPALAALAARAAVPSGDLDANGVHRAVSELSHRGLCALIAAAQENGSVRKDISVDVAAELVATLFGPGLLAVVARRLGLSRDELMADPARMSGLPDATMRALVEEAAGALRRALAP
jgi:TetR/AcrR family transcriptional regulator